MKKINEYPKTHHIPYIVVKNLVKASKKHNQFALLYSALKRNSLLLCTLNNNKICECAYTQSADINNYDDVVEWLYKSSLTYHPERFDADCIVECQYGEFFDYISKLTNLLLHLIFEERGLPHKLLGRLGQTTFDLTCHTILKDKYVEEGQKDIASITDPDELRSALFYQFLMSDFQEFETFISQLPTHLVEHIQRLSLN